MDAVLVVMVGTRCQCVERSVWPLQVVAVLVQVGGPSRVACCLVLSEWFVNGWNGDRKILQCGFRGSLSVSNGVAASIYQQYFSEK